MFVPELPHKLIDQVRRGVVIPAMPLALNQNRQMDGLRQRALARYYIDAGAGGLAVGVHTTQFAIREPEVGLFQPVLKLVSQAIDEWCAHRSRKILKIAGVCGRTGQAREEACFARDAGYHAGLLSLSDFQEDDSDRLIRHCREIARIFPLVGFYLQPAVGGRVLPYAFWREFAEIENVLAIKIAPFNRYQTIDVVRAVVDAGRAGEIALYTGNDDSILVDLLTEFWFETAQGNVKARIVGGLLGQWAVWTHTAVALLEEVRDLAEAGMVVPVGLLSRAAQLTDANAAIFDAANHFTGCIPGIHEVLRRQGLLAGRWCLDPGEDLSPGQAGEIDRVLSVYPWLNDDAFVQSHLKEWMELE